MAQKAIGLQSLNSPNCEKAATPIFHQENQQPPQFFFRSKSDIVGLTLI
jgi:hypothetical protein